MILYPQVIENEACWPEPVESAYQLLGGGEASTLAPKLPHLGLADILFMTLVMSLPKERRPWGIVTWMSDVFLLSRPSLYALTERTQARLMSPAEARDGLAVEKEPGQVAVSPHRLARTVLTAAFPGKMALRPMQQVLTEALDVSRSIGWLSELLTGAGEQAGQVLAAIDTTPLGIVVGIRDETFLHGQPLLLVIDPVSSVILKATVAPDRQAETWAVVLLSVEDQGVTLGGMVEDMARMYDQSLKDAELDLEVQKDTWHIERDGAQVQTDLERAALRATRQVMDLEKKLLREWNDDLFDQKYIPAVAKEEQLYEQHADFSTWLPHLYDALEVVDLNSGEIRDQATNGWLLEETLTALAQIDHPRVAKWVKTLRRHQPQLLTYLDWLDARLKPYLDNLALTLTDDLGRSQFIRLVAQSWRLKQALINGHSQFKAKAQQCQHDLETALGGSPILTQFVDQLTQILDSATRASSLVESINGLLKQFLLNRRSFLNDQTLQHYLDLFTLWHNMRVYPRGKRQGKSPYQLAGIHTDSDDWLELLGFPAAA